MTNFLQGYLEVAGQDLQFAGDLGYLLHPEGVLAGPPVPGTSDTYRVSGSDLTLSPQPGQLGEEFAQAFARWVSLTTGAVVATKADWASRMVCSSSTGSSRAR